MLQNVKVDIIYYLTNTDFEMEFNLCGCCRMRLLTDKANDRKGFINMLSRAVSRSRIIIACGGLFSETGLISTVAQAVGKPLEVADNAAYGIKDDAKIDIIKGSTPLVTPEGYFGGCIIESGPQTIILLSENRNIRKTIMKNLIHPYIEEFSMTAAAQSMSSGVHAAIPQPDDTAEEQAPEQDEVIEEEIIAEEETETAEGVEESPETEDDEEAEVEESDSEDIEEESEDESENEVSDCDIQDEDSIDFIVEPQNDDRKKDDKADIAIEETDIPMHIVPERIKPSKTNYYDIEYTTTQEGSELYIADDESYSKKRRGLIVPIIVLAAFIALIITVLLYLLVLVPIVDGQSPIEYFKEIFGIAAANISKLR